MLNTTKIKVGFGIGAVGKDMVYALVAGFLMYYYNTVLGVSSTFIGVLFMAVRVFDAFNDPMMGVAVGKTKTKLGKFRPWLIVGTATNAVVLYILFAVPETIQGNNLLVYLSAVYLVWSVTYTFMDIPFWSMIPAITNHGKERESLSVVARACAGVGYALPTAVAMTFVGVLGAGDERQGFRLFALAIAIIFIISIAVTVVTVKEKETPNVKSPTVKQMLTALIQNDQALSIVVTIVIFNASLYLTQNLALYFFEYDIGNVELYGVFATVGGVTQILSMTSLAPLRKKFEANTIFVGSIVTTIVGYSLLFILGTLHIKNIVMLAIAASIIFAGFGMATVLTTIFLADTVDYGQWKNGQRNESVVFSLQTFVVKLASAISVFIAGVGLDLIKLDVNSEVQSSATLFGMRVMMSIIPIMGLVIAIYVFRKKYKLNDEKLKEITKELKERKQD
ncbi:MAG: glycoside-pentoside-hexuronide (GPH):cation symporter [Clostridia bacterium]